MGPALAMMLTLPLAAAAKPCPPAPSATITSADDMTPELVEAWVASSASFARFAPVLREQEVDLVTLTSVSEPTLMAAGLPLGVAFKLKRCAEELVAAKPDLTIGANPPQQLRQQPQLQKTAVREQPPKSDSAGIPGRGLQEMGACDPAAVEAMVASCCASSGGHRRAQSGQGCDTLPQECAPSCAQMFISFYEQCQPMVASLGDQAGFERFYGQCQSATPPPPPPALAPLPPLLPPPSPPAPTPDHCVDSTTWVSDVGSVGCAQYGPGQTSWQPMCAAHLGQYVDQRSAAMMGEGSAQATAMFTPAKVTAAEACPVSCGLCPSCDDGKQNGGETGIDCGGPCAACTVQSSCGPIENSGLVGPNLQAICTGQGTGDTCFTQPALGFQPSTPGAAAKQCANPGSECDGAGSQALFAVAPRNAVPGHFKCTANGRWEGEPMRVLPILPTVCPAQVIGDHYSGNCESSTDSCVASCDEGYPASRGDGVFTCLAGVWIGDLVCEPITCGITLDKASPEESAFSVCTEGDTLGSTCTAFCREGFYSTVGTGVGSFECMDQAGGLWMQQGFSPWWESSLQCTRCPTIENCLVSSCTTGTDAQCSACDADFYGYRHDETPTRCLPNSVTLQAAGFDAEAAGIFTAVFSGTLGADFRDERVTTTVTSTASLSLAGTRVEPVAMNFVVTGGVLSLQDLNMVASSLQAREVGQITVRTCTGSLGDISIRDSTLQLTGAPEGLEITGAVDLYRASNIEDVLISGVTFTEASLSVQSSTALRVHYCDGTLSGGLSVQQQSSLHINYTLPTGLEVHNLRVQSSAFAIDTTPGQLSGVVDLRSSGTINLFEKNLVNVDLRIQDMDSVTMQSCDVSATSVSINTASWEMTGCQGSVSSATISQNSQVSISGGRWTMSTVYVSEHSHIDMTACAGSVSGLRVDGRADAGQFGSCDNSHDVDCDSSQETCCTNSGSTELCERTWQQFTGSYSSYSMRVSDNGCHQLALGSTFVVDNATAASTSFGCSSRYRGSTCDIVPASCKRFFDTDIGMRMLRECPCNGCGSHPCGCDGTDSWHHPVNENNDKCVNADLTC